MNFLNDIITYVRRIIKSPSDAVITDSLIIDYINRFWIMDVDARVQLFDLKTKYQFQTSPGYDQYNMPLYGIQVESPLDGPNNIAYYPMYQGFTSPANINGIQVPIQTQKTSFFNIYPNVVQQTTANIQGDGTAGPYTFTIPISPVNFSPVQPPFQYLLRGHVNIQGIASFINDGNAYADPPIVSTLNTAIAQNCTFPAVYITANGTDGSSIVVTDSGQFLLGNQNFGLLCYQQQGVVGNTSLSGGYSTTSNTINYLTGDVVVTFPTAIPSGVSINVQCYNFQCGLPRTVLFNDNTLTFRSPPDRQYLVEIDAYLSPAAFINSGDFIQFAYMCEYIARGAARKILSDTGDVEQFNFYEPLFREQETLVWKRSQRQFTSDRTQTIYSQGINQGQSGFNNSGGSSI